MGDVNQHYRKSNDPSYHLKQIYEQWKKFEQEHQLLQLVDFTTWQPTNGGRLVQSILDHMYTNNNSLLEKVEAADYVFGDHSPVIITMAKMGQCMLTTMQVRNWKKYSQELLLCHLSQANWTINTKDYNDKFKQRLMVIINKLAPFEEKKLTGNKVS